MRCLSSVSHSHFCPGLAQKAHGFVDLNGVCVCECQCVNDYRMYCIDVIVELRETGCYYNVSLHYYKSTCHLLL